MINVPHSEQELFRGFSLDAIFQFAEIASTKANLFSELSQAEAGLLSYPSQSFTERRGRFMAVFHKETLTVDSGIIAVYYVSATMPKAGESQKTKRGPRIKGICAAADALGVCRQHLYDVIRGRRSSAPLLARYRRHQQSQTNTTTAK
jgi:hypothetical protein